MMEFAEFEDIDYFLTKDPIHVAFLEKYTPVFEAVTVFDFVDGTW
jgi:hypothetical protein